MGGKRKKSANKVLSTREHNQKDIELFRQNGLQLIRYPLLSFEFPKPENEQLEKLKSQKKTGWVITSKNGARGLINLLNDNLELSPPEAVLAVGHATAQELTSIGSDVQIPTLQNARGLARHIAEHHPDLNWIHFCGNLKRPELGWELAKRKINYYPVEVYQTRKSENLPESLPLADAVLFYSPSAVSVWFDYFPHYISRNNPVCVAIGPTTLEALQKNTNAPVYMAEEPDVNYMVQMVLQVLKEKSRK